MKHILFISAACLVLAVGCGPTVSPPAPPASESGVSQSGVSQSEDQLFGNVFGRVRLPDGSANVKPEKIRVYLSRKPTETVSRQAADARLADIGWIRLPENYTASPYQSRAGPEGRFLIKKIPINGKSTDFTIIITAAGKPRIIIDMAPVLPGASMALQVKAVLPAGETLHVVKGTRNSRYVETAYNDELTK